MPSPDDIEARLAAIVGQDAIETGPGVRAFRVDNLAPRWVLFPDTVEALSRCLAAADAAELASIPVGNGTRLNVGGVPYRYDLALSTRRLRRVLAHEAADMTVTVEAGLTVADLNSTLQTRGQWLPLDPPHPEWTTIGALIATDVAGPLRLAHGKVRDLLLGIAVVLADGTVVHGGGRVVKNVAGYDLMKLFTGSYGTLGTIVEATFKVRPRPEQIAVWTIPVADTGAAVDLALAVLDSSVAPLFVEAVCPLTATTVGLDAVAAVVVGCGGSAEEVAAHGARLAAVSGPRPVILCTDGALLHAALRDFPMHPLAAAEGGVLYGCKLSVLPSRLRAVLGRLEAGVGEHDLTMATLAHVGSGVAVLRFRAALPNDDRFARFAEWCRETVGCDGGWVVFDQLPAALKERVDPWGAIVPGLELMRTIKATLDPRRRLSPGRFVGGI
jgi:glycolate dehydrogenase FAD-binding subunit